MSEELEIHGMEDLIQKMDKVYDRFAATCEEHLEKAGRQYRTVVRRHTPKGPDVKTKNGSIRKHMKNRWKLNTKVNHGADMEEELRNTSGAYHLVERGHNIVTHDGRVIGHIAGKHFFEKATQEYKASGKFEKEMNALMEEVKEKLDGG